MTTVEGPADGDALDPLQQGSSTHDAFHCRYCTPGQICSAQELINEAAQSRKEIRI